jgi:hypothetical protein
MASPLALAATDYARRHWRVIPLHHVREAGEQPVCGCFRRGECHTPGKHPMIKNWRENASSDVGLVVQWWRAWPRANVGIVMGGLSRLVAVDIDGEAGRESLRVLEETHGALPETLRQSTGRTEGGEHFLFTVPADFDMDRIRNRTKMAPGIDVRAEGGLIVAAPSGHPTGARYAWRDPRVPVAEMPSWLIKLATSQKARQIAIAPSAGRPTEAELEVDGLPLMHRVQLARQALLKAEPAISGRNGHGACLKATVLLIRGYCLPSEATFDLLWSVYNAMCIPAWSPDELMHKIESAEYSVSDESYPWRFMIPKREDTPIARAIDALIAQGHRELDQEHGTPQQEWEATPETRPDPTAGYTNNKPRSKRKTEGNAA